MNHDLLSSMLNEFIPKSILLKVILMGNDSSEYKGYGANLAENNKENDLYYAIRSGNINKSGILSCCIYTDVNESRQISYLKLISVIHNLFNNNGAEDHNNKTRLVISNNLHGNGKLLNDWNNPDFFPCAFPALFFLWRRQPYCSLIYKSFHPCMGEMSSITSF